MKQAHAAVVAAMGLGLWLACDQGRPAAPGAQAQQGPISYDGATSISDHILPLALPVLEQRSGVRAVVRRSGGGRGLAAVFAGEADVAGLSRALTPEERERKPSVAIIGYDALGIWVNDRSPLQALSLVQLRDLFSGKITSWKQLGGLDRPVVLCTERLDSQRATLEAFRQLVLDGGPFGRVVERDDPASCLELVASDPAAVTPASIAYGRPGIHTVTIDGLAPTVANIRAGSYVLTRPLLLVTREPPSGGVKALVDLLTSADGQALVARAGFVAAR
jgi:phosphate transport system substrate-binding protein